MKCEDHEGDGVRDDGDQGLEGWMINIGNQTATTDANGNWSITVGPGTFAIQEAQSGQPWGAAGTGFTETYGTSGYSVTSSSGEDAEGNDFGNFKNVIISGHKYDDKDGLASTKNTDNPLGGWEIKLAGSASGSATTASGTGYYQFSIGPGTYTLSETAQGGWTPIYSPTGSIVVGGSGIQSGGTSTGNDFGNFKNVLITGTKFYDSNADGKHNDSAVVVGWPIFLDNDTDPNNGFIAMTVSGADG